MDSTTGKGAARRRRRGRRRRGRGRELVEVSTVDGGPVAEDGGVVLAQAHGAQSAAARKGQLQRVGRLPLFEVEPVALGQTRGELVEAEIAKRLAGRVASFVRAEQL